MAISLFNGKYRFLSNFYPCTIEFEGITYPSTEHAYQAAKTTNDIIRKRMSHLHSPGEAKREGNKVTLRPDWEAVKDNIMLTLLRIKFKIPELKTKLIDTGEEELIEGNYWGDRYWGVCGGTGKNMLGKLLMQVRNEINKN